MPKRTIEAPSKPMSEPAPAKREPDGIIDCVKLAKQSGMSEVEVLCGFTAMFLFLKGDYLVRYLLSKE